MIDSGMSLGGVPPIFTFIFFLSYNLFLSIVGSTSFISSAILYFQYPALSYGVYKIPE